MLVIMPATSTCTNVLRYKSHAEELKLWTMIMNYVVVISQLVWLYWYCFEMVAGH